MIENELTKMPSDSMQFEGRLVSVANRATMSLSEAAGILGIHRTTAWALHKRGEFPVPVLRVGSSLRVVKAHLQQFLETGEPVSSGARTGTSTPSAG
jgi:excisionase family DNA binding protein